MFLAGVIWPAVPRPDMAAAATDTPTAPPLSALWLAPPASPGISALANAVDDLADDNAARAIPVLGRAAEAHDGLQGYALLYLGRAQLAVNRSDDARATARRLLGTAPTGYLADAARWLAADAAEAAGDWAASVESLRALVAASPVEPARAHLRLGLAAANVNDRELAIASFRTVYFDYPVSSQATDAAAELAKLDVRLEPASADELPRHLARAQALYDARQYTDARAAFARAQPAATGGDRQRIDLRVAECDYFLKHYPAAMAELRPLLEATPEAEFFYFNALRETGRGTDYVARARSFVDGHPADPFAELALNDLGTHFLVTGEDEQAAAAFAALYERFPEGPHADRAAWKAGWWKYKKAEYAETVRIFEAAAHAFPRNDYRPAWLYWAARAQERLGQKDVATDTFRRVIADYRNSYYGRQAARAMADLVPGFGKVEPVGRTEPLSVDPGDPPTNAAIIRALLDGGLYDAAIMEIRKAQLETGPAPILDATMAYALNRKGDLRGAIIRMRRAYPQFLADGGETLPEEIRRVIFPVAYWDIIDRYATAQKLDPYVMAALIAQESTFQPEVRSSAGAWGLMQILPSTGRQVARRLGIRPFTTARLKQPEVNVHIGMVTFAGLLSQYGSLAPALAAYNAGDSRVTRWLSERRDFDQDEFVDDIPFPETQNYVKRILGTAEDYRALYDGRRPAALSAPAPRVTPKPAPVKAPVAAPAKKGRSGSPAQRPAASRPAHK